MQPFEILDIERIRDDFPILQSGSPSWCNTGLSGFHCNIAKTSCGVGCMDAYYRNTNANIHRGVHTLAEEATAGYEARPDC